MRPLSLNHRILWPTVVHNIHPPKASLDDCHPIGCGSVSRSQSLIWCCGIGIWLDCVVAKFPGMLVHGYEVGILASIGHSARMTPSASMASMVAGTLCWHGFALDGLGHTSGSFCFLISTGKVNHLKWV